MMSSMSLVPRLQTYLRHSAQQQYEAVRVPPFTLFFHPSDSATYFNYAIPDEAAGGDLQEPLATLRAAFIARDRRPRFEFIEEFAPDLAPALRAAGFVEDARLRLMVCTPESYRPAPEVPGLAIVGLTGEAPGADVRDYLATARQGFDPRNIEPPAELEIRQFGRGLGGAFLARLHGEPAGVASFMAPFDGVTEVAGIATREPFRRRGVASALTARAVRTAFERGVTIACLSAADERAGRVYERVGFHPYAAMLFYYKR